MGDRCKFVVMREPVLYAISYTQGSEYTTPENVLGATDGDYAVANAIYASLNVRFASAPTGATFDVTVIAKASTPKSFNVFAYYSTAYHMVGTINLAGTGSPESNTITVNPAAVGKTSAQLFEIWLQSNAGVSFDSIRVA